MSGEPATGPDRDAAMYARRAHVRTAAPSGKARAAGAVLMLHGLGGDADQLWPHAGLQPAHHRIAVDLRGHGATELVGPDGLFTFDQLTRDLAALLDRRSLPPAIAVGVSMGAGVAARLAVLHPDRIRGLVLIRPAWLDTARPPNLEPLVRIGSLLRRHGPAGRDVFVRDALYREVAARSPAAAASLLSQFDAPSAVERSGRLLGLPASVPFTDLGDVAVIDVPALVIGTRNDPQHPVEYADAWAAAVRGAVSATVPSRDDDAAGYRAALTTLTQAFLADVTC